MMMMEEIFGAVLGLMLQNAPMAPLPYQPPMMHQQPMQQPQPPPTNDGARSHVVGHNGSTMILTVWPDKSIQIAYAQPKPELLAVGVRPGTVLVQGQWREAHSSAPPMYSIAVRFPTQ